MTEQWPDLDRLMDALEDIETGGLPESERDAAIGDEGEAVGRLQMHRIMVDECNRIMRRAMWTYEDRTDRQKSRDMCGVYLRHWGAQLLADIRQSEERMVVALARIWNGGPQGWLKASTTRYGRKALERWQKA